MGNDYFKVYRSLLADELWLGEPFTRGQAWIDLIGLANFGRTETFYRGELQIVKRGQIKTSCVWLANRWKWSRNKVIRYLEQLSVLSMITTESTNNGTTITIENYALYQDVRTPKGTTQSTADETSGGTSGGTQNNNKQRINKKEGVSKAEIVKSETVDGWLIETDVNGREYARKVDANA